MGGLADGDSDDCSVFMIVGCFLVLFLLSLTTASTSIKITIIPRIPKINSGLFKDSESMIEAY